MEALKKTDKIKLSLKEFCLVRSFQEVDDDGFVQYRLAARQIGELIKRFFSPKMQELKVFFIFLMQEPVLWTETSKSKRKDGGLVLIRYGKTVQIGFPGFWYW